jgi:heme ABC exporter ATP-binding subunit CcmA
LVAIFDFERLSINQVSRSFGRRRALAHVSFACDAGRIVGLLGPNGAGKSTLLAILATLIAPSSGEIRYGDRTSREAGPFIRGRLGLLAHDLHLYPELTARENLRFFAGLYRLREAGARVEQALDRAGLNERADDLVSGFSRGMRQRLALERALLHDPRLLLLDEPFTGLDDASTRALVERLRELRTRGRIVVLTTHDLDVADGLLDEAAFLRNGRLVAFEDARTGLRDRYRAHVGARPGA